LLLKLQKTPERLLMRCFTVLRCSKDMVWATFVAVRIIDNHESETINPRNADSYSEFLQEVNALKISRKIAK
jgi:hypothetical protein